MPQRLGAAFRRRIDHHHLRPRSESRLGGAESRLVTEVERNRAQDWARSEVEGQTEAAASERSRMLGESHHLAAFTRRAPTFTGQKHHTLIANLPRDRVALRSRKIDRASLKGVA